MSDLQTYDKKGQGLLPFIQHEVDTVRIDQRANDGYIDATALCKACNKKFHDYYRIGPTQEFLKELSTVTGIPSTGLIQSISGGPAQMQGTWVHPQIAINLAQWASPKFAVLVSQWVMEWLSGGPASPKAPLPSHLRRYLINRRKIPFTHFSMLDEMTLHLVAPLEEYGYTLPDTLMPDISMGRMFSKWCRDHGYDPETFPTYRHEFIDGIRPSVDARLYPNILLTEFRKYFQNVWLRERAIDYFKSHDEGVIPYLEKLVPHLPKPEDGIALERK